jgi:hypothetical protein
VEDEARVSWERTWHDRDHSRHEGLPDPYPHCTIILACRCSRCGRFRAWCYYGLEENVCGHCIGTLRDGDGI